MDESVSPAKSLVVHAAGTESSCVGINVRLDFQTIEADIKHVLERSRSENAWLVIQHRFGFAGVKARSLEDVGQLLGVTRERVRQIEERSLDLINRTLIGQSDVDQASHTQTYSDTHVALQALGESIDSAAWLGALILDDVHELLSLDRSARRVDAEPVVLLLLAIGGYKRHVFHQSALAPVWIKGSIEYRKTLWQCIRCVNEYLTCETARSRSDVDILVFLNKRLPPQSKLT